MHMPTAGLPKVLVDGYELELTENLYTSLGHIRCHDLDVTLWVDAICINQQDPKDKGHQVKQMGKVYAGADEVLIWLGQCSDTIHALLECIAWVDARATEAQAVGSRHDWRILCRRFVSLQLESENPSELRQALRELLQRPWFRRIWVLQEVAKARTARIMCGISSCPARTFALMPSILDLDVDPGTEAVLGIMPRLRKHTWWSSTRHLHLLLQKNAHCEATHDRDKIYALLGMSTDACEPEVFYPCYEKPLDEVFQDTACFLLFGDTMGPSRPYSFPVRDVDDLRLPLADLAAKTLARTEKEGRASPPSSMRTAYLILRYMSEGRLDARAIIQSLCKEANGNLSLRDPFWEFYNHYTRKDIEWPSYLFGGDLW